SFQLDELNRLQPRPNVAVVTNFSPNHLNWHGSLTAYREAKQNLLRWQTAHDLAVLNRDDEEVSRWPTSARRLSFGEEDPGRPGVFVESQSAMWRVRIGDTDEMIPLADWLVVPGRHNQINAAAAIAATLPLGASLHDVEQ